MIFDGRGIILFYRIADFRLVGLRQLAEQVGLGCANYAPETSLPLYVPGEITLKQWAFRPPITVYCSPNNPGAKEIAERLQAFLKKQDLALTLTEDPAEAKKASVFLLYLHGDIWTSTNPHRVALEEECWEVLKRIREEKETEDLTGTLCF